MADFNQYVEGGQPQHVDREFSEKLESACRRFFEHAEANARYSDQLNTLYADIDILNLPAGQRRASRAAARSRLSDDETLEPKPASMAIILPPGTGKTTAARRMFAAVKPGTADIYLPTVKLCSEFAEEFNDDEACSASYAVYEAPRGGEDQAYDLLDRSRMTEEDVAAEEEARAKGMRGFNCPKIARSDILSEAGASVRSVLCVGCDLRPSCGYWRQEEGLEDAREAGAMVVRPHVRLWTGSLIDKSNIKIVDEALIESSLKTVEFTLQSLRVEVASFVIGLDVNNIGHSNAIMQINDLISSFQSYPDRPVSDVIMDASGIKSLNFFLMNRAKEIEKNLKAHHGSAGELKDRVKGSGLKFINDLVIFTRQIAAAWKHKCPMDTMIVANDNVVVTHIQLPDIKKTDNLLVLDASFRGNFSKIIFPDRDFEIVESENIDLNMDIEWIDEPASTSSLTGGEQADKKARKVVRRQITDSVGDDVLVVASKKVMTAMEADGLPDGWHITNFGALRGKNQWKDVSAVAIVGRSVPDVAMIERQCAAYSLAAGQGPIQTVERYRAANGLQGAPVSLLPINDHGQYFHPCEFVWEFIKAKVHDEYIQALGRCRSIGAPVKKKALIISKFLPPELEDYVVKHAESFDLGNLNTWHQCLLLDILSQGYSLLSPSYLNHKYAKYGTKRGSLQKLKKGSNREMDVNIIKLALANVVVGPPHQLNPNLLKNKIVANYISDLESVGINLLDKILMGTRSIYNISIGRVPTMISLAEVVWGEKQDPSTLLTLPGIDVGLVEAEVPGLKIIDQETPTSRQVTVLTSTDEGAIATKSFKQSKITPWNYSLTSDYAAGTYFELRGGEFEDIEDMARKLTELEAYPKSFIIRGKHIDIMPKFSVRRSVRQRGGAMPFFEDAPRSWIMLDVDEYISPYGQDEMENSFSSPEEAAGFAQVKALNMKWSLPEPFRSARCFVQMSASCWLRSRDVFKCHVWFMLDKALTSHQCKLWIQSIGERVGKTTMYKLGKVISGPDDPIEVDGHLVVDTSVFAPVQPHFTAAPIIEGDRPFAKRSWLMPGQTETVECTIPEVRLAQKVPKGNVGRTEASPSAVKFRFETALSEIGDGQRGFNEGIKHAAMHASMILANRITPLEELVSRIAAAVHEAEPGNRSPEQIERYASYEFINDKIEWWLDVID